MMRAHAVLALALAGACAGRPSHGTLDDFALRRFQRVAPGVYRSGQPTAAQLRALVDGYRIRSIIKLNHGHDPAPPDVTVVELPLNAEITPSPEKLTRLLDEIDRAPKPVLVHCTHGEDRTGLIIALWRIRHGAPAAAAYAEMLQNGFHPYVGLWAAWVAATGWSEAPP